MTNTNLVYFTVVVLLCFFVQTKAIETSDDIEQFQPKDEDMFVRISTGQSQRAIFSNVELTSFEQEKLDDFQKYLNEHPETPLPDKYNPLTDQKRTALRYLQAVDYNNEQGLSTLLQFVDLQQKYSDTDINEILPILEYGCMYFSGRGKSYRTTVVFNIKKLSTATKHFEIPQIVKAMQYFGNYIETDLVLPGLAEGADVLLDASDLGTRDLPIKLLRAAASMADLSFRARTHKIYVMNTTWFIRKICNICYSFTPEFTAFKINILEPSENTKKLGPHFDMDKIEQKYGGNRPNDQAYVFPPNSTTLISGIQKEQKVIDKKQLQTDDL